LRQDHPQGTRLRPTAGPLNYRFIQTFSPFTLTAPLLSDYLQRSNRQRFTKADFLSSSLIDFPVVIAKVRNPSAPGLEIKSGRTEKRHTD